MFKIPTEIDKLVLVYCRLSNYDTRKPEAKEKAPSNACIRRIYLHLIRKAIFSHGICASMTEARRSL